MRRVLTALAVIALGFSASGCVTAAIAKDPAGTITALSQAGCKGSLEVNAQAATAAGVSPGSASAGVKFAGDCDPSRAQHASVATQP